MSLTIREEEYLNYGKVLYIANAVQEMRVTLDVGPRIISYNLIGYKNLMCTDIDRKTQESTEEFQQYFGDGKAWYLYGGHRLWVSPEGYPYTYYPDNDKVDYTVNGNVFTFTPPVEEVTGWHKVIEVVFDEKDAKVEVRHILTNKSNEHKAGAIWALSVTDKGNFAVVPQSKTETGFVPNRSLVMWDYTDLSDGRFTASKDYYTIQQKCGYENPFKIGVNNTDGKIVSANHGQVFKVEFDHINGAEYTDFGSSTEIYTCDFMLEVETLSPLYDFAPGESHTHVEKWEIYAENSTNIKSIAKYL